MRPIATILVAASLLLAGCGQASQATGVRRPAPQGFNGLRLALPAKDGGTHLPVGAKVPAMPMTALDGSADALEKYAGQPILLVFWATWCPSCTNEMPHLEALHVDLASRGLKLLAVNASNEKLQKLRDFVTWQGYTMPVFGQYTGAAARDFKINAIPTLYWIGRDGTIVDVNVGGPEPEDLRARTARLLDGK